MNNNLIKEISTIEDLKNRYNKYIDFLKNHDAKNILHSNNNLLHHLKGTMSILVGWNVAIYISTAGLFHSVYGTKDWEAVTTSDRDTVKSFIGDYAESLVWEFHKLKDRYKDILEGDYSDEMRQNLMAISWANSLEQNPIGPKAYLHQQWEPHLKAVDFTKQKYLFL